MDFIETTITEHVYNQGWIKGETKGKVDGKVDGKIEGEIEGEIKGRKNTAVNLLNMGIDVKVISQATGFNETEIKQLTAL